MPLHIPIFSYYTISVLAIKHITAHTFLVEMIEGTCIIAIQYYSFHEAPTKWYQFEFEILRDQFAATSI